MNIIITASDGTNTTIEDFILTVNPVNDAPTLNFNFIEIPEEGNLFREDIDDYNYSVIVYDVDAVYYYNGTNASETLSYEIESSADNIIANLEVASIDFEFEGLFTENDDINIINFTSIQDYYGQQSFELTITDSDGLSDSGDILVEVSNVNDPPIFDPSLTPFSYLEDETSDDYIVNAIDDADFSDPDSDFSYECESGIHVGCDVSGANIIFSNITNHFNGEETITITTHDGDGGEYSESIEITVVSVNDAPVAVDVFGSTEEDTEITSNFSGTDVDDTIGSDTNNGDLIFELIDLPTNGEVTNNNNGTYTYIPEDNFFGEDTFTYRAIDDEGLISDNIAIATINVVEGNDAPVLNNVLDVDFLEDQTTSISVSADDVELR